MIGSDKFSGGSFLIPRSVFDICGKFNENLKFTQDYEMWLRFYDYNVHFKNLDLYLFFMRIHSMQDTNVNFAKSNLEKNKYYLKYMKNNFSYFLNFFSSYDILILSFKFQYRSLPKIRNFLQSKLINYLKHKKQHNTYVFIVILVGIINPLIDLTKIIKKAVLNKILFLIRLFTQLK